MRHWPKAEGRAGEAGMSSVTADGVLIAGAVVFVGLYVGNSVTQKLGDKLDAIIRLLSDRQSS